MDPEYAGTCPKDNLFMLNGACTISCLQEKFKKCEYPKGNQFIEGLGYHSQDIRVRS